VKNPSDVKQQRLVFVAPGENFVVSIGIVVQDHHKNIVRSNVGYNADGRAKKLFVEAE